MMKSKILLTTIPSDSHSWNLIYIHLLLEENGFEVFTIGPCTSYDEVERACLQIEPDVVLVSTVNGHGYIEGKVLIKKIRSLSRMKDLPIFIGGKLSTDKNMSYLHAMELETEGFTKAYYENKEIKELVRELKKQVGRVV